MNENQELAKLTPEQRDQLMAQTKQKLQLPADADDVEVVVRLVALIANLQQRYETAVQSAAQTQGEMANRDLEAFKDVIPPEQADFWHGQLMANREPTLQVLSGLREKLATPKKPVVIPLHNRTQPVAPRTPEQIAAGPAADAEKRASWIANRANEIVHNHGLTYVDAFDRAVREHAAANLK